MKEVMDEFTGKKRHLRLADLIKEEISRMLIKGLKDPRVDMVNITHVKVSGDLRFGKVYFRVSKTSYDIREVMKGLKSASAFIKRELLKALGIKFVPELEFLYDNSLEYAEHMEKIFAKIRGDSAEE